MPITPKLPPLSDALHRLITLTENEKLSPQTFELLVARDPALIARLIGCANSVSNLRGGPVISSVKLAIRRLGTRPCFDILLASFAVSSFETSSHLKPLLNFLCHHIFSLQATAYRCAPILGQAYTAPPDLMHLTLTLIVRKLGIIASLSEDASLVAELDAFRKDNTHWFFLQSAFEESLRLSSGIGESWGLDSEVIDAVTELALVTDTQQPLSPLAELSMTAEALVFARAQGARALESDTIRDIPALSRLRDHTSSLLDLVSSY